jgi:hypothetical protein
MSASRPKRTFSGESAHDGFAPDLGRCAGDGGAKRRNHDIGWAMTDSRRKADVILVKDGLRVRVKSACINQDDWLLGSKL